MGKRGNRGDKDLKEVQLLKEENKKLRRQVRKLRSVISNLDLRQYEFVNDLLKKQTKENKTCTERSRQKKLEAKWACFECGKGILRLIVLTRLDGTMYFRRCDHCENKTRLKVFTDEVVGVLEEGFIDG